MRGEYFGDQISVANNKIQLQGMMRVILLVWLTLLAHTSASLPTLLMSGFSWAENLAFDGLGSLFVSDVATGIISRIYLCGDQYCKVTHMSKGIESGGGLVVSSNGLTLYAGVTLSDKSKAIISTSTRPADEDSESEWTLVAETPHKPNGMAMDWSTGTIYGTHEGMSSNEDGSVFTVNIATAETNVLASSVEGADGCWFDPVNSMLFVGKLVTMEIWVYDVKNGKDMGFYPAASSLKRVVHMLDDITLQSNGTNINDIGKTMFFGADFTGKQILSFSLDGSVLDIVPVDKSIDLQTPTSVRFGMGPGFCEKCIYVTEGGGLTEHQQGKRVVQLKLA